MAPARKTPKPKLLVDPATSLRLSRIRQHGTAPELLVGTLLRAIGLRFTRKNRDLPGSPDLANRRRRWVVFVHGCFWHGHAACVKATVPRRNRAFWIEKFAANRARDRRKAAELRRLGYTVVIIWECQLKNTTRVAKTLESRLSWLQAR